MFQKSNDVCNFKACKVLVKTLGQNCEFCRNRFCLQHSLAEVHGCGDEAKKQARAQIKKAPKSEHQSSYAHQVKHKYLEKKFHEKMDELKSSRARNKKNKDDN
jgi:ATP-dependent RNA/DNA helicase IGHMBP2